MKRFVSLWMRLLLFGTVGLFVLSVLDGEGPAAFLATTFGQEVPVDPDTPVVGGTPGTDLAKWPVIGIESVIGTDQRVQITNTTVPPWRWIAHLEIAGGWTCTGFFIGPRILATAGHCVYSSNYGGDNWADSIRVIPGRNGTGAGSEPFGSQTVTQASLYSVTGWTQSGDPNYDYGWIVLPNETLHDQVGSFGIAVFSDAEAARQLGDPEIGGPELSGRTVNLAGYPGDKPYGTMWYDFRAINTVNPNCFSYEIDTFGGQSGSPVWNLQSGNRQVVGIHTYGTGNTHCDTGRNVATRITDPRATNFESDGAYIRSVDPGVVTCRTLTKSVSPAGTGSISHAPPNGGGCPTDSDSPRYADNGTGNEAVVELTANPNSGYQFTGWSGACTGTSPTCTITMNADKTVTATFSAVAGCTSTAAIFRIERATGNACADGSWNSGGADVAEFISASEALQPGDVVEIDPQNPKSYRKARSPYSTLVAGVISTRPGLVLGLRLRLSEGADPQRALGHPLPERGGVGMEEPVLTLGIRVSQQGQGTLLLSGVSVFGIVAQEQSEQPLLALVGRVPVKATTENGPIQIGDLLTSSSQPGYAMRCESVQQCEGAIIGKALETLDRDEGVILMLVVK